jgi:hypothetical protein
MDTHGQFLQECELLGQHPAPHPKVWGGYDSYMRQCVEIADRAAYILAPDGSLDKIWPFKARRMTWLRVSLFSAQ